ncbi:hypothetical protein U91I_00629 [alpha proteobacterium U9-1i]|nr:hypothetical protein U91I_00629 [alpha proteobacterium U9-1i]
MHSARAPPGAIASSMSDALFAQGFMLAIHLVACLNLVLIGALAWTKT